MRGLVESLFLIITCNINRLSGMKVSNKSPAEINAGAMPVYR